MLLILAICLGFRDAGAATPGSLVAWGVMGNQRMTVPALARSNVIGMAAGEYHAVALKADGSVVVWGSPDYYYQTIVPEGAQSGVTAVDAGFFHTVALKDSG